VALNSLVLAAASSFRFRSIVVIVSYFLPMILVLLVLLVVLFMVFVVCFVMFLVVRVLSYLLGCALYVYLYVFSYSAYKTRNLTVCLCLGLGFGRICCFEMMGVAAVVVFCFW